MAEGQRRLPRTTGFGATLASLSESRAAAFVLRWYAVPLATLFGVVSALHFVTAPEHLRPIFDDSYISLSFAGNLADHGKLSFDGEHWSTGATSPLHVALLALLLKLGVDPFEASAGVGVVATGLLAAGVYGTGYAIFRSRLAGLLGALAIAGTGFVSLDAGSGLETSLFMSLVALTAAVYLLSDHPGYRLVCGELIALAVLTRPEGALLLPAVLIYRWVERPSAEPLGVYAKDAARLAIPGVIAAVALAAYALAVDGSLGGTATAKLRFFQEDEQSLQDKLSFAANQVGQFVAPLLPLLALAAIVAGRRAMLLAAVFWTPVLVAYFLLFPGGLYHNFYRYQHPVLPFIAAFAGGGAAYLIGIAAQRDWVVKALVVAALVIVVVPVYSQYDRWRGIYVGAAAETYTDLEPMAIELNTIIRPDETLATHDIGAVQYFAGYDVLDLVGLVNRDVIAYHDDYRVGEYIDDLRPDYVLLFDEWDRQYLHLDAANHPERFELVKAYPGGEARPQTYYLYRVHYQ